MGLYSKETVTVIKNPFRKAKGRIEREMSPEERSDYNEAIEQLSAHIRRVRNPFNQQESKSG